MGFELHRNAAGLAWLENTDEEPLDDPYAQAIVEKFYTDHQDLPLPRHILQYEDWYDVRSNPHYDLETLIFVDASETAGPLELGMAVVISYGGAIEDAIACGVFYQESGTIGLGVEVIPRYWSSSRQQNWA